MSIAGDVRLATRALGRTPVLAGVVVISLGIGIGVNSSVFTWIQAMMLDPVPGVSRSGALLLIEPRTETGAYSGASWREYQDVRRDTRSFEDLVAFRMTPLNIGEPPNAERTFAQLVSGNYFSGLGLHAALGRLIGEADVSRPGAEPIAVISYDYWQTYLNRAPDVVGRPLRANGSTLTIVGVAPERFQGTVVGLRFDVWVPATMAPALLAGSRELDDREIRGYSIVGRLKAGETVARAAGEIDAVMAQLAIAYPNSNRRVTAELLPYWWAPRGPQRMLLPALGILQAVMVLVLIAVCGNTANLMLVRAAGRHREVAVRISLGAGRWRVVRLVLTETVLLGFAGAALGSVIALWGTSALRAMPLYGAFPIRFQTQVDGTTLLFALGLGLLCGILFGIAPAVQLARLNPQRALRIGSVIGGRSAMSRVLMATEVALALVVLVAGALFLQRFAESRETDPHFRREGLWLAAYDLSGRNVDAGASRMFAQRALERVRTLPSVESAAIASSVPLDIHGMGVRTFTIDGRARSDGQLDEALTNTVTRDYFKTMGIGLVAGQDFADLGDASAPAQTVVNEAFARRFLQGTEPIGHQVDSRGRRYLIVGVVATSTYQSFGEEPTPIIYFSYRDRPSNAGEIHVRVRPGADASIGGELRQVWRDVDPALPLYNVRTMSEHIERNLFLRRIPARMFMVLAPLLLCLAALGIYAVVSHAVSHRTREMAIRIALGATRFHVVSRVVGDALTFVLIGAAAGWLLAFDVYAQWVGDRAADLLVFAGVPAILLAVAAVAAWLPARRAGRINPAAALKE